MARRITLFIVLTFSLSWSCWGVNIWLVRTTGISSWRAAMMRNF